MNLFKPEKNFLIYFNLIIKKKSLNRVSFLNDNKSEQFIEFNNTNDDTFKK